MAAFTPRTLPNDHGHEVREREHAIRRKINNPPTSVESWWCWRCSESSGTSAGQGIDHSNCHRGAVQLMKLIIAKPSPFARKARVALLEKKIAFEVEIDTPWNPGADAPLHNPLGKIPILMLDDGRRFMTRR